MPEIIIISVAMLVFLYLFLFFLASRLFIPYLGFKKAKLPEEIPEEIMIEINKLKKRAKSKKEFLLLSYNYLTNRFRGERLKTFTNFHLMFINDLSKAWNRKGFIQCNLHNHLLRIFLVKSGFFSDEEIRLKHTFLNFNIHQYLQVCLNGEWVDVDLWGKSVGIPLGKHAWLFR